MTTTYRRYDPRLKNLVAKSGDIDRFKKYGIPASSLRQWVKDGPKDFFTLPEFEMDTSSLVQETLALKLQIQALQAKHELFAYFGEAGHLFRRKPVSDADPVGA